MKNVFLSLLAITGFVILVSCKNVNKKVNKATETTNQVVKDSKEAINKTVDETTKAVKQTTTEASNKMQDPKLIAKGKALFTSKTCVTCHREKTKLVGPALQVIAKTYKEKNGNLMNFFKGKSDAIVDIPMAAVMHPNVETITKEMSDSELKALIAYINSTLN